jgi:hypothetical protein
MAKKERKTEKIMIRLTKSQKKDFEKILEIQNKDIAKTLREFVDNYINAYRTLINFSNIKGDNNDE